MRDSLSTKQTVQMFQHTTFQRGEKMALRQCEFENYGFILLATRIQYYPRLPRRCAARRATRLHWTPQQHGYDR